MNRQELPCQKMDDCRGKFDNDTGEHGNIDRESLLRRHCKGSVVACAPTGICKRLSKRALFASGSSMDTVYEPVNPRERAPRVRASGLVYTANPHNSQSDLSCAHSARIK